MFRQYNINENLRSHGGLLSLVVALSLLAAPAARATSAKDSEAPADLIQKGPPSAFEDALPGEMLVYSPKKRVDRSSMVSLGPPEALGGQVLSGHPQLFGRIDFQQGNLVGGLFMATTGLIRVTFPFTEHATIIEGSVTLTDETGKRHTFKVGDSYIIRQGAVVLWDVKGPYVIKSFFNVTAP